MLLERLGPDRVAHVEGNAKATSRSPAFPELAELEPKLKAPDAALPMASPRIR
ncbi:MAG: hypothetical protein U1E87_09525 [Alphaproteobacteria bacterium]